MASTFPPNDDRRYEQFRKLTEVSRALTYTTSLEQVLRLAVERAAELLNGSKAILMLLDAEGLLQVHAALGVDDAQVSRFREPLDESLLQRLKGLLGEVDPDCFIGVPLVSQGDVIGLLAVVRTGGEPCEPADEWLLSALADQAAVATENARLAGEVGKEKQARTRALQGASEAKERALASLSHDLRSPLNAIDSYAELLEMEIYGPLEDRQREALGRIRLSGRHLLAVLDNVMQMARLTAGVVRLDEADVRIANVVSEAVNIVLPSAHAKEQSLSFEIPTRLVVRADPDSVRQAFLNLLGNAIKFTPRNGSIRVSAAASNREAGAFTAIAIADTGPGIPGDAIDSIFEPYYRVSATASEPGVGLGLAISRELIRRMGGDVTVQSELGRGSIFTVTIPLHGPVPAG